MVKKSVNEKSPLAKVYTERFVQKYSDPVMEQREPYFELNNVLVANGESMFGPVQAWPAQLDSFSFLVSEQHSHRKINYETMERIILLERPELVTRGYRYHDEYFKTMEQIFNAGIGGMRHGKLERVYKKELNKEIMKEKRDNGLFKRLLKIKNQGLRETKVINSSKLKNRVNALKENICEYSAIRYLHFDGLPIEE